MGQPRAKTKGTLVLSSDNEAEEENDNARSGKAAEALQEKRKLKSRDGKSQRTIESTVASSSARTKHTPSSQQTGTSSSVTTRASASQKAPKRGATSVTPSPKKASPQKNSIAAFFNKATQAQQTRSPTRKAEPVKTEEDFIDDDISEDDVGGLLDNKSASLAALPVRKRSRDTFDGGSFSTPSSSFASSQKFLKTAVGHRGAAPGRSSTHVQDQRPWTERYGPTSVDELAVHKRKVNDVLDWLRDVYEGQSHKRLLVLKGPAGAGKTVTLQLLCKQLGIDISEWRNPASIDYSADNFTSMSAFFEDYIARSGRYSTLEFGNEKALAERGKPESKQKQLVLVEEFPNTFTRSSTAVQSFRGIMQQFLAANVPSLNYMYGQKQQSALTPTPIVMIISETLLSNTTASADSFTAHRLLGSEILNHQGTTMMEFNPVAPTFMKKALELIVVKESRKTGRRRTPGPQVIDKLAEIGDIRSAISSLEFLCVRGDEGDNWGSKIAFTKPKKPAKVALTKSEEESLKLITQRESALGIFHSVGRVVYNKRLPIAESNDSTQPPTHLPQHKRNQTPETDIDQLLDEMGTDIQTFVSALHENYILSTSSPSNDIEDTLDSIDASISALSDADLQSPDRFSNSVGRYRLNFNGSGQDGLRQEEMSFHVASRGLLFALPSPVKRAVPPAGVAGRKGGKADAHKMFYPVSLQIWRQQEEIEDLLELWIERAQRGELSSESRHDAASVGTVESWRNVPAFAAPDSTEAAERAMKISPGRSSAAKAEMLLERLPYMATILDHRWVRTQTSSTALRDINKIIRFTGIGGHENEEVPDDEDIIELTTSGRQPISQPGRVGPWPPPKSGMTDLEVHRLKKFGGASTAGYTPATSAEDLVKEEEPHMAQLVLSDDDIED